MVIIRRHSLRARHKRLFRQAADRWEELIVGDLVDIDFSANPYAKWNADMESRIAVRDTVDDLRIFVRVKNLEEGVGGQGGPIWIRLSNLLPILATITIDPDELQSSNDRFYALALHEITHCLGFGTLWNDFGLLQNPSTDLPEADTHFPVVCSFEITQESVI